MDFKVCGLWGNNFFLFIAFESYFVYGTSSEGEKSALKSTMYA